MKSEEFDRAFDDGEDVTSQLDMPAARHRAAGLDQMVADAEEAGLYDLPADVPFERLPIEDGGE